MIFEGIDVPENKLVECDICIAGTGAAGSTIALELEKQGKSVVLIEAGGTESSPDSQKMYDGKSTGLPYSIAHTRLRALGGTTQHWAGYCAPLDPEDFEPKKHIQYSGWPISRRDLDPYYIKASKALRLGDYNADPDSWVNPGSGYDSFDTNDEFVEKVWHFNPALRFGDTYKKHYQESKNITLFLNSALVDLPLQGDFRTVKYAKIQTKNHSFRVKAKHFVLACGGIENPRLLLNFNKQHKNGLGNEHDNVGRYFQEHPEYHHLGAIMLTGPKALTKLYVGHNRTQNTYGCSYLQINPQIRNEKKLLNAAFHLHRGLEKLDRFGRVMQQFSNRLYRQQDDKDAVRHFQCIFEQEPNRNRRVSLSSRKDSLGLYKPEINIGLTSLDYISIQNTIKEFSSIIARSRIGRVQLFNSEILESPKSTADKLGWGNHHMGSTRMSETAKDGVVDTNCRVHSTENLFVGGSSVFPTSGCANPTFTIVALAMRLAEHLGTLLENEQIRNRETTTSPSENNGLT